MPIDPEVKAYLDSFRQSIETRYSTLERELSNFRRNPPLQGSVEFASDQAQTACIGVAELRAQFGSLKDETLRLFELEGQRNREAFVAEATKIRGVIHSVSTKANNRTRLWAGGIASLGVVLVGLIGLWDRLSTTRQEHKLDVAVEQQLNRRLPSQSEHDRRLIEETTAVAMNRCMVELDIVRGNHGGR